MAFGIVFRNCLQLGLIALAGCASEAPGAAWRPKSVLALRYEATVPQSFDYTCGASSVATLLTFYWNRPTSEADALNALKQRYTIEEIAQRRDTGLSFDDLIFIANRLGFEAQGAKLDPAELPKLDGPVIVHLQKPTFQHFVVLRKVGERVYYVSDPVVGELAMAEPEFRDQFSGYVLAVWKSGAALPQRTWLDHPRDGLSLTNALAWPINAPRWPGHPVF